MSDSTVIRAVAVHPGTIYTGLTCNVDIEMLQGWMQQMTYRREIFGFGIRPDKRVLCLNN